VWRDALLRTTGFPADGVDLLAGRTAPRPLTAISPVKSTPTNFDQRYTSAVTELSARVDMIAGDVRLREAVTWQNPAVVGLLDSLRRSGSPKPRNSKRRYRRSRAGAVLATVLRQDRDHRFLRARLLDHPRPGRRRRTRPAWPRPAGARRAVFLEPWALATYAAALAEDPQIRMWLPPCPMPHYVLAGELLQRPGMPAIELTPEQAAAVALCDGTMPAAEDHQVARIVRTGRHGPADRPRPPQESHGGTPTYR